MKTLIPLILAILFCLPESQSQYFARKDSKWVYVYFGWFQDGYNEISYLRDTVFSGSACSMYKRKYIRIDKTGRDTSIFGNSLPLFLKEENGVVEFADRYTAWDTLYNFKAQVGDYWYVGYGYTNPPTQLKVLVKEKFEKTINGRNLKGQILEYISPPYTAGYQDTIYEYIGNTNHYLIPGDLNLGISDGSVGGPLKCFYNQNIGSLEFRNINFPGYQYDCDQLVSNKNTATVVRKLFLYPNPVFNQLSISMPDESIKKMEIFDILGKRVHTSYGLSTKKHTLILSELSKGVYFLKVNGKLVRKFLKG